MQKSSTYGIYIPLSTVYLHHTRQGRHAGGFFLSMTPVDKRVQVISDD